MQDCDIPKSTFQYRPRTTLSDVVSQSVNQSTPTYAGERERRGLRDLLRRFLGLMLRRRILTGLRDGLRLRATRAGLRDTLLRRRATGLLERSLCNRGRAGVRKVFTSSPALLPTTVRYLLWGGGGGGNDKNWH